LLDSSATKFNAAMPTAIMELEADQIWLQCAQLRIFVLFFDEVVLSLLVGCASNIGFCCESKLPLSNWNFV